MLGEQGCHQQLKFGLPFLAMGFGFVAVALVNMQMRDFVNVGDQELKRMKVFVYRYLRGLALPTREIAHLGLPALSQLELKWRPDPELMTIVKGRGRYAILE